MGEDFAIDIDNLEDDDNIIINLNNRTFVVRGWEFRAKRGLLNRALY